MNFKRYFVTCSISLFLLLLSAPVSGIDYKKITYGEITPMEYYLKKVDFDTAASAVVLSDVAKYYPNLREGLTIVRHKRIKILKAEGIAKYGDFKYKYYSNNDFRRINSIQAQTINLSPDNVKEVSPVESKNIYRTSVSKDYSEISFAFPSVKVGSILEFEITTTSHNLYFPDSWSFQTFIPTLYSEVFVGESPDLQYIFLQQGVKLDEKYKKIVESKWCLENLPALIDDEFIPNPYDFGESIKIQLSQCSYPISRLKSWYDFSIQLLTNSEIKGFLKTDSSIEEVVRQLAVSADTLENIKALYNFVSEKYKWDDTYSLFPEQSRKKFMEKMIGNSAEKNFLLVCLLRAAGYNADPVALSTRSNGRVFKESPIMEQFNHVVAYLKYKGKPLYLDASSPGLPYDYLDKEVIMVEGMRLNKKDYGWVVVQPASVSSVFSTSYVEVGKDLIKGKIKVTYKGNKAKEKRILLKESNKDKLAEAILKLTNVSYDTVNVVNETDFTKELQVEVYFHGNETGEGNMTYIASVLVPAMSSNPFVASNRDYPVYLQYPMDYTYNCTFAFSKDFKLDEKLEDSKHGISPNDTFTLMYGLDEQNRIVQVNSKLHLNTLIYLPDRYFVLQNFFNNIITKSLRPITLKKI